MNIAYGRINRTEIDEKEKTRSQAMDRETRLRFQETKINFYRHKSESQGEHMISHEESYSRDKLGPIEGNS